MPIRIALALLSGHRAEWQEARLLVKSIRCDATQNDQACRNSVRRRDSALSKTQSLCIQSFCTLQRWATNCLILHNPVKMMRVAYQVRSAVDGNGACNWIVDQAIQQRVLVSQPSSQSPNAICP